ncbi:leucine-rich repeat-containing protein kinase family protein [Deefgea rivuli]|uniref:leucine-rich repeat-containing protein kinase family protein n=1 Tax=Deefgea rivuli TaxID=400948 RepID=UPI0005611BD7|nr:leucine-rich repeat-containing protein kinase family protein [Deefgea rivuli]
MQGKDTLARLRNGELAGIKRLDLSCGLTEFPCEIFALADSLEILNLSGNRLSSLPDDLWRLHQMQIIFCSDNLFTQLPVVLGNCAALTMIGFKANQIVDVPAESIPKSLRWLVLTDNQIGELPASIGACAGLQKLMLAGNQLTSLPAEMAACQQLELIRLAANQLHGLPEWLLKLPKLSWLALGGNPLNKGFESDRAVGNEGVQIAWSDLEVGELLGEGASGTIYRAQHTQPSGINNVALKLFKGEVTSDGLPQTEMAVCRAAGSHANLIGVHGQLIEHPEQMQGLVVPLIEPQFTILAQPPSLTSCTRDVYAQTLVLEFATALSIARSIASAALHLHQQGILHGDLYAHNILHDVAGHAYLGDFGAASFYAQTAPQAELEKIEVRAFGVLLAELLERIKWCGDEAKDQLQDLAAQCCQVHVLQRPRFVEVLHRLDALL